ncbi:GNAT family N-acetyltransferase [Kribbella solani]|uniref:Ribosomal protein S18 acetylase RimI-like enzyme n=1 Tax=Kribbella solani TaxID=236067 RepID=A0A841DSP7_9ACTN|nr:GNAT family N-acetyltransferase [Kribbella solani]MBB5980941.1 ribosomal protein S18 acetylase RimI-like enzyme [Kribbella solani]
MSTEIRRATVADAETVLTLMGELADYQDQGQYLTASVADWQGFLARAEVVVLIAEVNGDAAGYVSALRRPYLWVGGDLLALDDLYVRERYRDAGVGRQLMLGLARHALPDRLPISWGLRVENTSGYRFYERLGAKLVTKTAASWSPDVYAEQLKE